MMTIKNLKIALFALITLISSIGVVSAQNYHFAIGSNLTKYQLVNSQGVAVNFLKPGSGIHMNMKRSSALVDTLALIANGSERGAYYTQHPTLAKIFSILHYDIGLVYNQYNSLGGIQNIAFDYKTDFVGLAFSFGPEFNLGEGLQFAPKIELNGQKMLQGTQLLGSNYYDLSENEQFSSPKFFGGISAELIKKVNSNVSFFLKYQYQQTLASSKASTGNLDFTANTFAFGLNFKITK